VAFPPTIAPASPGFAEGASGALGEGIVVVVVVDPKVIFPPVEDVVPFGTVVLLPEFVAAPPADPVPEFPDGELETTVVDDDGIVVVVVVVVVVAVIDPKALTT
jgi:hypothetical protein